ncbi:MAG: TetR/AcrR family transcriptional regulator [Gordonibacter pamelaeae]|nr:MULTISPECIES: TetR/AcrR family transcriptional regulator [Eggerthellaceae]MBS4897163.1 TetR/AcrR family transcriptional regulator [Gordonibacter pamelaeae]MCB5390673.1 TetR/AcrR family transcriptional regulator [Eggerthella lenta]MCB6310642.1 TetR/AcrR family transcriptional regulator [Gordonibacter pamelaeae]
MPRTVKDPEERKAELLDTAMRLFAEKGYDNVSVRSVAREAGVASGLAYHYFDSKQRLFDAAIGHYAERCSEGMRAALDDGALSLDEKIEGAIAAATEHAAFPHGSRLHAEGNGTLHDRLSLGICEAVRPHMQAALELDAARRGAPAGDAALLASMMVYACVGLASGPGMPDDAAADAARRYLGALVAEYRRGPSGR